MSWFAKVKEFNIQPKYVSMPQTNDQCFVV